MTDGSEIKDRGAAYDKIDRYLRNNLNDADYAEMSAALECVWRCPTEFEQWVERVDASQTPKTFTDPEGQRWSFDPSCRICSGRGSFIAGYSGREDDGNAPIWENCDCFIQLDNKAGEA